MPLLDHFHPPLSDRRPWESFHTTWASALADSLNQGILPPGFLALEHIHAGPRVEIDIATFSGSTGGSSERGGGTATVPRAVWTPAAAPVVFPATFPPEATVEIVCTEGGRTLVAAIEIVSPGNKDRAEQRRLLAGKCAAYLAKGIGVVVVDVVTSRRGNLHNDLADLIGLDSRFSLTPAPPLYTAAYRPLHGDTGGRVEAWPVPLAVGQPLPAVPLSLGAELCVRVDLETSYAEACRRRRVAEALE